MKFAVPLSGTSKIETRLRSILDPRQSRAAVTKKLLAAISLVTFAAVVPLAAAKEPAEADEPAKTKEPIQYVHEAYIYSDYPKQPLYNSSVGTEVERVVLTPSKKTVVTGFKFSGNKALSADELRKLLVSKTGVLLNTDNIVFDRMALHRAYDSKGIRLRIKEVVQNEAGVITYELQENSTETNSTFGKGTSTVERESRRRVIGPTFITATNDPDQPSISRMALRPKGLNQSSDWHTVTAFRFIGNKALSADELQKLLVSKTGAPLEDLNVRADATAIRKAYIEKGLAVQVRSAALDESGIVSYSLLENHVITGFKFNGNKALSADSLQKVLVSKTGALFKQQGLVADRRAIEGAYTNTDFYVVVQDVTQDDAGFVSYTIQEMKPPKITQIKLEGLVKTDPQTIRELITTPVNKPFNASTLRSDLSLVYNTNLFEDATFKIDDDPKVPGGVVATFMFKEKANP